MRFKVEQTPRGRWRVMLAGTNAPVSEHDTEGEARECLAAYARGAEAASAPTAETGIARGERVRLRDGAEVIVRPVAPEDKGCCWRASRRASANARVTSASCRPSTG